MKTSTKEGLRTIYRRVSIVIALVLLVECFDAFVTPRTDWFWFGPSC